MQIKLVVVVVVVVAGALPHLLALQVLDLGCNCFGYFGICFAA